MEGLELPGRSVRLVRSGIQWPEGLPLGSALILIAMWARMEVGDVLEQRRSYWCSTVEEKRFDYGQVECHYYCIELITRLESLVLFVADLTRLKKR